MTKDSSRFELQYMTRFEAAKQDANQLEDHGQPFFGVPLILKGLGQDFAGAPATFGSRFFAKAKSEHTNNFVKALQRLGFIIVGQSNVPEFGFKNINRKEYEGVNLDTLQLLVDNGAITDSVSMAEFVANRLATKNEIVKILGRGELKAKLKVTAHKFTATAKAAIEAAGGEAVTL